MNRLTLYNRKSPRSFCTDYTFLYAIGNNLGIRHAALYRLILNVPQRNYKRKNLTIEIKNTLNIFFFSSTVKRLEDGHGLRRTPEWDGQFSLHWQNCSQTFIKNLLKTGTCLKWTDFYASSAYFTYVRRTPPFFHGKRKRRETTTQETSFN